jgi:DNA-binding NarL/FixJ family response regulator
VSAIERDFPPEYNASDGAPTEAERRAAAAVFTDPNTTAPEPFDRLTPRELSVALRLADGARSSEIAEELGISPKTVDTHRANVLKKLSLRHNVDIARAAIKAGLVTL